MSFIARNNLDRADRYRSRFSLHEEDNADQYEECQSTRSDLPAEIPDSQPDPYLPSEIPDSQPDVFYRQDLPFGDLDYSELSSQLPTGDYCDLDPGDTNAAQPSDWDLSGDELVNPSERNLDNSKDIDSRVNRFDRVHREEVNDRVFNDAYSSSSSCDTEIIVGGTRLTKRLKDRVVSLRHHPPFLQRNVFRTCLDSSRP